MREGAAILLSETLAANGETVIDREERLQAFDRLQLPAARRLSRASTIKVGQAVTASLVIGGTVAMQGDQLVVRARVIRLDSGRLLPDVEASGPLTDLFARVWPLAQLIRACRRLRRAAGRRSPAADAAGIRALRQGSGR